MKEKRRGLGLVILLVIIAALAVPKLISSPEPSPAAPAKATPEALRVRAHRVVAEPLRERLATTGTVRANEQVELVSEIAGKVQSIHFQEGGQIEAGELLVELDAAELRAGLDRARHRLELAAQREERQAQLLSDGVISQQTYDFALSERKVLEAEQQLIEAQLEKTEIRAPFSGIIGFRHISLGSYLTPQTPIASLQDVDPVKVEFSVPEKYAARMRVGETVRFRVEGRDGPFSGEIYAIEPSVDAETRSLVLRARAANPRRQLLPGAFADVEITVREVAEALVVPSLAVIPELGGKKVFVVENGAAQPRPVETGIRGETRVEITSGIEEGELVITSGLQQLRPGQLVEIVADGEAREATAP